MGARTGGRAIALQLLFALDTAGSLESEGHLRLDVESAIRRYWASFEDSEAQAEPIEAESRAFGEQLVRELAQRLPEIDAALRKASVHWRLERMPRVDRNVARLGALELITHPEIPRAVAIDESVELAKRFGGDESSAFVNGLLERVADDAGRMEPREGQGGKGQRPRRR
jgi:N utilization substance protein B